MLEAEAPPLRPFGDAVVEPSDRVDQRKRPVAQRVELVQPARLEPRGNDEYVGARLDPVGKPVVEAELRRYPAGIAGGKRRELLFQRGVTRAEVHELDLPLHHARHRLCEDVVPLLVHEPADGRAQHRPWLLIETDLLLQRRLADRLSREVLRRVPLREQRIPVRAPALVVDAVHDPGQIRLPVLQQSLEPGSSLLALDDLAGVGRRDGGQLLGKDQTGLHQIQLSVELHRVGVEEIYRKIQLAHRLAREHSLVRQVVDGEDASRADGGGPPGPAALDDQGHQRALPIVGMDGVRDEVPLAGGLQRTGAEQSEALVIVAVVLAVLAVQLPAVVPGVLQEEVAQPLGRSVHVDVRARVQIRKLHLDAAAGIAQPELLGVDRRIAGQDHQDVVAAARQGPGEGADDVAQPAGLDVRRRFRRDEEELHGKTSVCRRKLAASSGGVGLM